MKMLKRKNLVLLVPVLTILAMALVGCSNNDDGGNGGGSGSGGGSSSSSGGSGGGSSTVAVTGVKLGGSFEWVNVTNSITLTATVEPSNATNKKVTWRSSDESVATVDQNGKVTGVDRGYAIIIATTSDGNYAATAKIFVEVPVTGVSLSPTHKTMYVGSFTYLTAKVIPSNANNRAVTWWSYPPSVAKVDNYGKVTAVSAGVAKITVRTKDGNHTATATITVKVHVASVSLNKTNEIIYVGGSTTLTATVLPSNANQAVTWKSNNTGVATVDQNGKVTAVNAGVAKITVTTADGGKTATANITVKPVPVMSVSLNKTSETIYVGGSTTLTATVSPSNAGNKAVTWKSNNTGVATVDNNGKVTGVDGGTATITVKTEDGGKTATADITVKVHVASVSLNKNSVSIEATGSYTSDKLTATVLPSNAANKAVTWSSDNPAVATVNQNGTVTAKAVGSAKITATTDDGNHTATATVTVSQEWDVLGSTITVPTNGSTPITFPMDDGDYTTENNMDDSTGIINHKFSMAQTEVTYELWKKVYDWANKGTNTCNTATGQYCYTFASAGKEGNDDTAGATPTAAKNEPVTNISWRDAIVWCNAYTEWYNAEKGGSLTVVYYTDGSYITPLRTSTNGTVPNPLSDATAGSEDKPYIKASFNGNTDMANNTATGFRLPTSEEWEFAARLRTDSTNTVASNTPSGVSYPISIGGTQYWFTKGDSASGAKANYKNATETGKVAWYGSNSCDDGTGCSWNGTGTKRSKAQDVATKKANALGLYDMSGNVLEWCFDVKNSSDRVERGGEWLNGVSRLQVGNVDYNEPNFSNGSVLGFRVVRTQ